VIGAKDHGKEPTRYDIRAFLKRGDNSILVRTGNTKGLLLQASIEQVAGKNILLVSDESWQASKDQVTWLPALNYAYPPQGAWGKISRPGTAVSFPCETEYQQELPPGAEAIVKPAINGRYEVWVNGQRVDFKGASIADISRYLKEKNNLLSLRVIVNSYAEGLQEPVEVICGKTPLALGPWSEHALGWYSGKAIYTHSIDIDAAYCNETTKLLLDLGQVNHFAEIWVNDRLVTYRAWAPFKADITRFVHPGKNKIAIVVANLLANEATWSMLDDNIDNRDARWWNFGSIMREKDKLVSGLQGPVQLVPYIKTSYNIPVSPEK
jgi:hypothetical protein